MALPVKTLVLTVNFVTELEAILLAVKSWQNQKAAPTMKTSVGGCIEQKN
jgi:hypothetical protein